MFTRTIHMKSRSLGDILAKVSAVGRGSYKEPLWKFYNAVILKTVSQELNSDHVCAFGYVDIGWNTI